MRSLPRAIGAVAALLLASVGLLAAPASAQGVPQTLPTATLSSASITFTTNDEDKDGDTQVQLRLYNTGGTVVSLTQNTYGHFDDYSVHGPYALNVPGGIRVTDLQPGKFEVFIVPANDIPIFVPHDTWRFNYTATLNFSDGSSYQLTKKNIELSEWNRSIVTAFTPVTQVVVPNVAGQTAADANTTLRNAGLSPGDVTTKVDPNCEYVNKVMSTNPSAGSVVDPGTRVNLTVGTKPKNCN